MEEEGVGFVSIIDALVDDKTSNFQACERLVVLAGAFRSMETEAQDAVYNQDHVDDMQQLVDAMFTRIQLLESEEHGVDAELQGRTLAAMLRLMPMGGITSELARCLFMRGFHGILGVILDGLFELPHLQDSTESQQLLCLLLQAFTDLAEAQWTEPNERRPRTGRDEIGNTVMEKLLTYMPQTKYMSVSVRRGAATLLLALIMRSKNNQALLGAFDRKSGQVFGDFLASCGDYTTQLDIMEALYRCCKGDLPNAVDKYITYPQVREKFKQLLAKSSKAVDLATELREVLLLYNATVARPSVNSFKALSIHYVVPGGPRLEIIRPASMWADVGNNQVTCYAAIHDQAPIEGAPADDVPEEPLDFVFNNLRTAKVSDVKGQAGVCEVELTMQQRPAVLEGHPALPDGDMLFRLVMHADKTVAAPLLHHLPRSAICVASQDPEFLDLTQPVPGKRKVKMSMGIPALPISTMTSNQVPSGVSHKAPLPLRPTPARQAALSASLAAAASGWTTNGATTTHNPTPGTATAASSDADKQVDDGPARSLQQNLAQTTPGTGHQASEIAQDDHSDRPSNKPSKTHDAAHDQQEPLRKQQAASTVTAVTAGPADADGEGEDEQGPAGNKQLSQPVAKPRAGKARKGRKATTQEVAQPPAARRQTRASLSSAGSPPGNVSEPQAKTAAAEKPTAEEPADRPIAKPAAVKPTAANPAAAKPAAAKPAARKSASDKPAADKPSDDEPAAAQPTAAKRTAGKRAAKKPAADTAAASKPITNEHVADKPTGDKPGDDQEAVADRPAADKPATSKPASSLKRSRQAAAAASQDGKRQKADDPIALPGKQAGHTSVQGVSTAGTGAAKPQPVAAPAPREEDMEGPASDPAWLVEAAAHVQSSAPAPAGAQTGHPVDQAMSPLPSPSVFHKGLSRKQQRDQEVATVAADADVHHVAATTAGADMPARVTKAAGTTQQRTGSAQKRTPKLGRLAALGAASPGMRTGKAGVMKPRAGSQPLLPPKAGAAKAKSVKAISQAVTPPRPSSQAATARQTKQRADASALAISPVQADAETTAAPVSATVALTGSTALRGLSQTIASEHAAAPASPAGAAAAGKGKPPKPAVTAASKSATTKNTPAVKQQQQQGSKHKDASQSHQEGAVASLDAIEGSLPVPAVAVRSKQAKINSMRAGSVDEIEDPDASLMSPVGKGRKRAANSKPAGMPAKRQRTTASGKGMEAEQDAQQSKQPDGKRPRRAASTKAAEAIRQQADDEGSLPTIRPQDQQLAQTNSMAGMKKAPTASAPGTTTIAAAPDVAAGAERLPSVWAFADEDEACDVAAAAAAEERNKQQQKRVPDEPMPAAAADECSDEECELGAVATLAPPPSPVEAPKHTRVTASGVRPVSVQPSIEKAMSQAAVLLQQEFAAIDEETMLEEDGPDKEQPASPRAVVAAAQAVVAQMTRANTVGHVSAAPGQLTSPPHTAAHRLLADELALNPSLGHDDADALLGIDMCGVEHALKKKAAPRRASGRGGRGGRGGAAAGQGRLSGRGRGGRANGNSSMPEPDKNTAKQVVSNSKFVLSPVLLSPFAAAAAAADDMQHDSGQSPLDQLGHGSNVDEQCIGSGGPASGLPHMAGPVRGLSAAPQPAAARSGLTGLPPLSLRTQQHLQVTGSVSALRSLKPAATAGKSMPKPVQRTPSYMPVTEAAVNPDDMAQEEHPALMSQLMQALADDDEGGDEEAALLQAALLRMINNKKQQLKGKQAVILQEAWDRIKQDSSELEAKLAKEARNHAALANRTMKELQNQLDTKMNGITMLQAEFEKAVSHAWDEYVTLYNQLAAAKREVEKLGERRRAAAQKQVAALRQQADGILANAAARAQQLTSKTRAMPGLSQLLRSIENML